MKKRLPYPPDSGLKKQVRDPKDCFSVFTLIRETFFRSVPDKYDNYKYRCPKNRYERGML